MSRAMNVRLSAADVTSRCELAGVSISAIEVLPSGDTHLVCTTSQGAEEMRHRFKEHIVEGRPKRAQSVPPSRW